MRFAWGAAMCLLLVVAGPAVAAVHPAARLSHAVAKPSRPASKPHAETVTKATHAKGKAVRVQDAPAAKPSGKSSARGKAGKVVPKAAAKSSDKRAPTAKRRRPRQEPEPENDPPILHRANAKKPQAAQHGKRPVEPVDRASAASDKASEAASAFPDGAVTGHHQRRPGPAAAAVRSGDAGAATSSVAGPEARQQATSDDFLRAAGIARTPKDPSVAATVAAAETFERGESHPDEDVSIAPKAAVRKSVKAGAVQSPVIASSVVTTPVAVISATPAVLAPTPKRGAKVPALPEDLAGKDAVIEAAMTPMVLPNLYVHGRLVVPPPMKGSREILVHQNTMADADGLDRIQDDEDLNRMRAAHLLVPIADSDALEVNSELPANRRYARPWTARFVQDTAKAYYAKFGVALRLNSAVRTVSYQLRLQRVNGNAAAVDGDGASPHLTGQAIDFGKRGMTTAEIAWMRAYLGPIMESGKIDVEEEFQQACFHISVYKAYMPVIKKPKPMEVAQVHAAPIVRRTAKVEKPAAVDDDMQ